MKFAIFQESRIGRRKYNQDRVAHAYTRESLLVVVADGMGGHLHGEVASHITVELFMQHFQQKAKPTIKSPWQFLKDSALRAHDAILTYAANHHMMESPRTTCVAAIIQDGIAYWAHVGDSRFYLFRKGACIARTRDHSKVQQLIDRGEITQEEAEIHPERNRLYNCLGSMMLPEVELGGKIPLNTNDTLLLCTDGLWGVIPAADLTVGMSRYPVQYGLPQLMDKAEIAAGPHCDNVSAIGVTWLEDDAGQSETAVSTGTLPLDAITTTHHRLDVQRILKEDKDISEDDIERAIQEIQDALQKYSKP